MHPSGELVVKRLLAKYGDRLHTALEHRNAIELFVAVLLSPQNSDEQVNKVTKKLFEKYKSFSDYANAEIKELESDISSLNFYKTKARHLKESARLIEELYSGSVPRSMQELLKLPGVGRKVANVILNELYGINEGIAVDTHCITVANRLGFAKSKNPAEVEKALLKKIPKEYWGVVSNLFIALGRDTCKARGKECERCVLKDICPSSTAKNKKKKVLS
ncbi:MAG: endonuclease III domain-containing protein [Candidatus Micrarchaeia archaeon]|jgi:endonuclease-3